MSRPWKAPVAVLFVAALAGGCGASSADVPPDAAPADAAIDVAPVGRVVTWGSTGFQFRADQVPFIGRVLAYLTEARQVGGVTRILYTWGCDPRTDAHLCLISDDPTQVQPFLDMLAQAGEVDFRQPSESDLSQYSAVFADFSGLEAAGEARISDYIQARGRVLVVGDRATATSDHVFSAVRATTVTESLGLRYSTQDPSAHDILTIAPEDQVGLLEGVSSIDTFRMVPQLIDHSFEPVMTMGNGDVLSARLELQPL